MSRCPPAPWPAAKLVDAGPLVEGGYSPMTRAKIASAAGRYNPEAGHASGPARARGLFVHPDVFHAPAVVDAVRHDRQTLDVGLPAVAGRRVEDDRASSVLGKLLLDFPDQRLALVLVGLHRLLVDHLVELGVAVFVVVALRTAHVVLVEILVGLVDAVAGQVQRDDVVLAVEAREPLRRVDRF